MARLFGTNGIRDVVGTGLTAPFVTRIAAAVASVAPTDRPVAVGWDGRTSSDAFARIVTATLALAGRRVVELGLLPTPAVQYNVPRVGAGLGVIVTASHNPAEFNGVKCIAADGLEVPREVEAAIETAVERGTIPAVPYDHVGEIVADRLGATRYLDGIVGQVDRDRIARQRLSVVLDCANGAGAVTSPTLLRRLGCRGTTINGHVDGTFPGHPPEPTEANLASLARTVTALGADLGVAHDGDADRAMFVEGGGRFVPGEEVFALLARDQVARHPGSVVVTSIASPASIEEAVRAAGGSVVYTRVGSPAITHEMQARRAVFGGEDNGGLVLPAFHLARDGAMALAAVLDLMARKERTLADLLQDVPRSTLIKEKTECPIGVRERVMARVTAELTPGADRVVTLDGVKVFGDGGSLLLRPSGTEPLVRVTAEGKDPATARRLADRGLAIVRAAVAAEAP